jgi:hypothetical protein
MKTLDNTNFSPITSFIMIEKLYNVSDPKILPYFLLGEYDQELKRAFFFKEHDRCAETLEELDNCTIINIALENLKTHVRETLQQSFNQQSFNQIKKEIQRVPIKKVSNTIKSQHDVSKFGTVSEIAEKHNITKNKVRELKRNGELSDFIKSLD